MTSQIFGFLRNNHCQIIKPNLTFRNDKDWRPISATLTLVIHKQEQKKKKTHWIILIHATERPKIKPKWGWEEDVIAYLTFTKKKACKAYNNVGKKHL